VTDGNDSIMTTIAANLHRVRERIGQACAANGRRASEVALLAVSKTFGVEAVIEAIEAGQVAFGENYVQEGVEKIVALRERLPGARVEWHCIGPLQSNKTRLVAEHFDWVQSVDRLKIAQRLSAQRPEALPALQVCVQVNIDGGPNKSGVAPEQVLPLAEAVRALPRLRLRGLMCIPEPYDDARTQAEVFGRARALFERLRALDPGVDTLSMGMSEDLEAAIAAGSTMVRVGRGIFGYRPRK
jgi:pyridoxal phosphate enzyme (YggS family)